MLYIYVYVRMNIVPLHVALADDVVGHVVVSAAAVVLDRRSDDVECCACYGCRRRRWCQCCYNPVACTCLTP